MAEDLWDGYIFSSGTCFATNHGAEYENSFLTSENMHYNISQGMFTQHKICDDWKDAVSHSKGCIDLKNVFGVFCVSTFHKLRVCQNIFT
jgi:hypothetical protein